MVEIWPDEFEPSAATIDGARYIRLHFREGNREVVVGYHLAGFVALADQLQMLAEQELRALPPEFPTGESS